MDRERDVTSAFVLLARSLVVGDDVVDLLSLLTERCASLLDVQAAGLLLADRRGVLHVMAASSEDAAHLEALQVQRGQGPCHDCYRSGQPVSASDLDDAGDRWPQFVPAARQAGFASVHALPLRLRDNLLGALGLFGPRPGALDAADLNLGQALADVASIAIVQDRAAGDSATIARQLQTALDSRVVLEQAKGVLAYSGGLDMAEAFQALRQYGRDHNLRLSDAAAAVVERTLPAQVVISHARPRARGRS